MAIFAYVERLWETAVASHPVITGYFRWRGIPLDQVPRGMLRYHPSARGGERSSPASWRASTCGGANLFRCRDDQLIRRPNRRSQRIVMRIDMSEPWGLSLQAIEIKKVCRCAGVGTCYG